MKPHRRHHIAVAATVATTRIADVREAHPATSQILPLWSRFFGGDSMGTTPLRDPVQMRDFGTCSSDGSDASCAFDVTAGVAVIEGAALQIEAGASLVFTADGSLPQDVTGAWVRAWQHSEAHPEVVRCCASGLGACTGPIGAAVYAGVE